MSPLRKSVTPSPHRKWLPVLGIGTLVVLAVACYGKYWVTGKIESTLIERLQKRELDITWKTAVWNPFSGMHMTGIVIRQSSGDRKPVVQSDNLTLHIPVSSFLNGDQSITYCSVSGASMVLTDHNGDIALRNVTARVEASEGKIVVTRAFAKKGTLVADLTGEIKTTTAPNPNPQPLSLQLEAVRGSLAALDFREGAGDFKVTGTFNVDASVPEIPWTAKLKGAGKDLDWKGYKLTKAEATADLSSSDAKFQASLFTPHAEANGVITRAGWEGSPFVFKGTIKDSASRADEFHGNYEKGILSIEHLHGPADLWQVAAEIRPDQGSLPEGVSFQTFPEIDAKNIRWKKDAEQPWSIGSVNVKSQGPVVFKVKENDIEVKNLRGNASFDGKLWAVEDVNADLLGGSVSLDGTFDEGKLQQSTIKISRIRLAEMKQLADRDDGKPRKGVLSVGYKGSINFKDKLFNGSGSMRLENAPVFEVPLLDEVYELFAALIPGIERSGEGQFDAEFTAKSDTVEVTKFDAKGGSLTVSAIGTVDLQKERVSGRARGKLTGIPGLVTSPLSRLLELDVAGPYDDIRVKPLGPAKLASNAASGTVGVAVDVVEEAGRITGTVLTEGIKMPFRFMGDQENKPDKPKVEKPIHRR